LLANERTSVLWTIGRTLSHRLGEFDFENADTGRWLLHIAQAHHLADYLLNKELGEAYRVSDPRASFKHFMLAAISRDGTGKDRRLYREMARYLKDENRFHEAIAMYKKMLAEFPDDRGAPVEIAELYRLLGQPQKARKVLESLR
jgi:tetratricopeptide (TPR) repeat protein